VAHIVRKLYEGGLTLTFDLLIANDTVNYSSRRNCTSSV